MLPINPVFDGIRFGELWEAAWASAKSDSKKSVCAATGWGRPSKLYGRAAPKMFTIAVEEKRQRKRACMGAWMYSIDSFIFIDHEDNCKLILSQTKLDRCKKVIKLMDIARNNAQGYRVLSWYSYSLLLYLNLFYSNCLAPPPSSCPHRRQASPGVFGWAPVRRSDDTKWTTLTTVPLLMVQCTYFVNRCYCI